MRTIFDTAVSEVFKRIDQQSHLPANQQSAGDNQAFAKLLGDLEKTNDDSKLVGKQGPVFSNLNVNEWEQNVHLTTAPKAEENQLLGQLNGPQIPAQRVFQNVKIPESYVKNPIISDNTPPEPTLNLQSSGQIPSAPKIIHAQRVTGPLKDIAHLNPTTRVEIVDLIKNRANFHGLDPNLSLAVATAESSLNTKAISQDGFETKGLFQLKDTTGQDMLSNLGMSDHNYDPFDPKLNSHLGTGYLKYLFNIFNQPTQIAANLKTYPANSATELEKLAVAAFNTGQGNVAKAQARAIREGKDPGNFSSVEAYISPTTRQYVGRVFALRSSFAAENNLNTLA